MSVLWLVVAVAAIGVWLLSDSLRRLLTWFWRSEQTWFFWLVFWITVVLLIGVVVAGGLIPHVVLARLGG